MGISKSINMDYQHLGLGVGVRMQSWRQGAMWCGGSEVHAGSATSWLYVFGERLLSVF